MGVGVKDRIRWICGICLLLLLRHSVGIGFCVLFTI
jgi:hypothetical protein